MVCSSVEQTILSSVMHDNDAAFSNDRDLDGLGGNGFSKWVNYSVRSAKN